MAKHLSRGRLPGLRADQINELTETVQNLSSTGGGDPAPPAGPKSSFLSGQFPIRATLKKLILPPDPKGDDGSSAGYMGDSDDGDGDGEGEGETEQQLYYGYEWEEVRYDPIALKWVRGYRAYDKNTPTLAFPIGIEGDDEFKYPDFEDVGVLLWPANAKNGKPILTFQVPPKKPSTFVARITGYSGGGEGECAEATRRGMYTFTALKVQSVLPNGQVLYTTDSDIGSGVAWNVADGNGSYGGKVLFGDDADDCTAGHTAVPCPVGKFVTMHRLSNTAPEIESPDEGNLFEGGPVYVFFVKNDLCIECCTYENEGLLGEGRSYDIAKDFAR